jgi:hypothetical protein
LRPANEAAEQAVQALGNGALVSIVVKGATPNQKRLAFYWSMLGVAAENMAGAVEGGLTADDLHGIVKQKLSLGRWLVLPSGDRVFRPASISFARMKEPDRAAFVARVDKLLCGWLGVPVGSVFDAAKAKEVA